MFKLCCIFLAVSLNGTMVQILIFVLTNLGEKVPAYPPK